MRRVDFNVELRPYHPSMKAQTISVIWPMFGPMRSFKKEFPKHLTTLRALWQKRLIQLYREGWESLQSVRLTFVCNCPPFACGYEPKTQSCNLRICPFCHARRMSAIYERIRKLLVETPGDVQVAAWRCMYGYNTQEDRIFYDADMGLSTYREKVDPRHREIRRQFQRGRVANAIGGVYWYTVAPYTYQRTTADGSAGRWNILHGCVAVMPADWQRWESDDLRVITNPDDYQLAWLVGRTFQYRRLWFEANPAVLAAFLNATKREVFLSAFGRLGPNYHRN